MPPSCHPLFPSAYDYDQGVADASSTGARLHHRSSTGHAFRDYARSPHNPDQYSAARASRNGAARLDPHARSPPNDPYYGARDSWNEAARSNPRKYDAHVPPPRRHFLKVDVSYGLEDEDDLPQGG